MLQPSLMDSHTIEVEVVIGIIFIFIFFIIIFEWKCRGLLAPCLLWNIQGTHATWGMYRGPYPDQKFFIYLFSRESKAEGLAKFNGSASNVVRVFFFVF